MNILVIKQTSLGDVLHATGHVRAIKRQYPHCHLTLLTADTSAGIFRHNPYVDEIIEFERYRVKRQWWRRPAWTLRHLYQVMAAVRARRYDLAIDLQGRWKSVLFLYGARAGRRFVKGNWPFVAGFRDRELHALVEMSRVLEMAGIDAGDAGVEFFTPPAARERAAELLEEAGLAGRDYLVLSPFTRWPSKNWPLDSYAALVRALPAGVVPVVTGAAADRAAVEKFLSRLPAAAVVNLCGALDLETFAAVVEGARAVVSGDSFAMHLAWACRTPVVALFGPTAESRVAPTDGPRAVLRADVDCCICYRRRCPRRCIDAIGVDAVLDALAEIAGVGQGGPDRVPEPVS